MDDIICIFKKIYTIPDNYLNNYIVNDNKFNIYNNEDEKNK